MAELFSREPKYLVDGHHLPSIDVEFNSAPSFLDWWHQFSSWLQSILLRHVYKDRSKSGHSYVLDCLQWIDEVVYKRNPLQFCDARQRAVGTTFCAFGAVNYTSYNDVAEILSNPQERMVLGGPNSIRRSLLQRSNVPSRDDHRALRKRLETNLFSAASEDRQGSRIALQLVHDFAMDAKRNSNYPEVRVNGSCTITFPRDLLDDFVIRWLHYMALGIEIGMLEFELMRRLKRTLCHNSQQARCPFRSVRNTKLSSCLSMFSNKEQEQMDTEYIVDMYIERSDQDWAEDDDAYTTMTSATAYTAGGSFGGSFGDSLSARRSTSSQASPFPTELVSASSSQMANAQVVKDEALSVKAEEKKKQLRENFAFEVLGIMRDMAVPALTNTLAAALSTQTQPFLSHRPESGASWYFDDSDWARWESDSRSTGTGGRTSMSMLGWSSFGTDRNGAGFTSGGAHGAGMGILEEEENSDSQSSPFTSEGNQSANLEVEFQDEGAVTKVWDPNLVQKAADAFTDAAPLRHRNRNHGPPPTSPLQSRLKQNRSSQRGANSVRSSADREPNLQGGHTGLLTKMELFILEVIRRFNPIPAVPVVAKRKFTVRDLGSKEKVQFPAGTPVLAHISMASMDESKFRDPMSLFPQRESLESSLLSFNTIGVDPLAGALNPYGLFAEERACLGRRMAVSLLGQVVAAYQAYNPDSDHNLQHTFSSSKFLVSDQKLVLDPPGEMQFTTQL